MYGIIILFLLLSITFDLFFVYIHIYILYIHVFIGGKTLVDYKCFLIRPLRVGLYLGSHNFVGPACVFFKYILLYLLLFVRKTRTQNQKVKFNMERDLYNIISALWPGTVHSRHPTGKYRKSSDAGRSPGIV